MHRECGFIRMQPGTNRVAFIIAQNSGIDSDINLLRYQRSLLNYHYNVGKCGVKGQV